MESCLAAAVCSLLLLVSSSTSVVGRAQRESNAAPEGSQLSGGAKNVLLIIVDDLRPQMTVFNQSFMTTPNFARLASEGTVFERAYCQVAVCVPSRNSFLSGRRPDKTRVWPGLASSFRDTGPDWISLPEHFKSHGYTTLGGGKTYHPGSPPNWDEPKSWSQDKPYFPFKGVHCPNSSRSNGGNDKDVRHANVKADVTGIDTWCALDEKEYPESWHYDWTLANETISTLNYVKNKGGPWFVAAGFRRPHVPWMMPKRFWDMYSESGTVPAPEHVRRPLNSPDIAYHNQGVFNNTDGVKYTPMPEPLPYNIQQAARQAYFASVSFTDYNVGRVLDALDKLDMSKDTVVALFGDHGFQLGEHDSWHKQTNWELAARTPLIVRVPWKPASVGQRSYALVELIDMYRTLAELAGTPQPSKDVDGSSFAALFDNPSLNADAAARLMGKPWTAAFSQYLRCVNNVSIQWDDNSCSAKQNATYMGYSMRTPEWRYTAWMKWTRHTESVDWSAKPYAVELYDHSGPPELENDFNYHENENVASQHADVVTSLQEQLKDFFQNHYIPSS